MATPQDLTRLDAILERIQATQIQRCFIRNYVIGRTVTGIDAADFFRTEQEMANSWPRRIPGLMITGRGPDGRAVEIVVGPNYDRVDIRALQPDGTYEVASVLTRNRDTSTTLMQGAEFSENGTMIGNGYREMSTMVNGRIDPASRQVGEPPPTDDHASRHTTLHGYLRSCMDISLRPLDLRPA